MREFKFRAWDKRRKTYIYPDLWDNKMPSNWSVHYILEQYTGLKDKNGKEIYEGDIINGYFIHSDNSPKALVVKRDDIGCCYGGFWTESDEECRIVLSNHYSEYIEVTGNIHAHPELLNQVK